MSLERLDQNLCDLIVESIGATVKTRVFCAYEGATGIALDLAIGGADVSLDIHQERLSALCTCLALAGDLRLRVRQGDPFQLARADMSAASQLHDAYDVSVVVPPINKRHEPHDDDALGTGLPTPANSEAIGVTLALARASKLAMCLLPPNFLFRSSTTDKIFREHVIRKFGIDTIVGLPSGMFSGSMISSALLFFKPSAARGARSRNLPSVFMIDAREGWKRSAPDAGKLEALADLLRTHKPTDISVSVSIDDLAANNFDLSVGRYVLDPLAQRVRKVAADETLVSLEDLVELYRPQAIPSAKGTASAPELTLAEVGVADIDEAGLVRYPSKQLAMAQDVALQARRAHLESGDVLLVIKGSVGKIGFVRAIPEGTPWLASQSFAILRLRQHAPLKDPRILFRFLSSGLGQSYIRSICVGTAVPTLQMATVRRLMIVLPSPAEQESIAREVEGLFELQDQIQKLRADLAVTQGQIWPETPKTTPLAALSETGESRQESTPHRKSAS
jgi:type I restriction enzyme M protein